MGRIPDGIYNVIGQTIEILQRPGSDLGGIGRLAAILERAKAQNASVEQVRASITKEAPQLQTIGDALPTNRAELYAFIALLLTALTMILGALKHDGSPHIDVNQVINVYNQQTAGAPSRTPSSPAGARTPKRHAWVETLPVRAVAAKSSRNATFARREA
jgi:hypothetical protein